MRKIVLLIVAAITLPAFSQVFNMEGGRVQITPLRGLMRFHTGDNPLWSDPGCDDSAWPLMKAVGASRVTRITAVLRGIASK